MGIFSGFGFSSTKTNQSTTQNTTNNYDQRQFYNSQDDNSTVSNTNSGNTTFQTLDAGAVGGSLSLAGKVVDRGFDFGTDALHENAVLATRAMDSGTHATDAVSLFADKALGKFDSLASEMVGRQNQSASDAMRLTASGFNDALSFAKSVMNAGLSNAAATVKTQEGAFLGALSAISQDKQSEAVGLVDRNTIMLAGLAVVGVLGLAWLAKKKG